MATIRVIAFDPGVTTGFACGLIDTETGEMEVTADQEILQVDDMFKLLDSIKPDHVVFETFEFRRNQKRDKLVLFSKELIGVIELWCRLNSVLAYRQSPAAAKAYFTDTTLRDDNVYRKGMPHANDAMRHLLRWYTFGPGFKYNKEGYKPA